MRRRIVLGAAVIVALMSNEASGDPIYHIKSPSVITTEKGSELKLPPGYFMDEPTFKDLDLRLKTLEENDTRLRAENQSLRKTADEIPWKVIGSAIAFGVLVGFVSFNMQ